MCGIFGIYAHDNYAVPSALLEAMGQTMVHRGPDDRGWHIDGPVGIGMQRLSILDIEHGHQPLTTDDRQTWLVCNGEIYNFQELRADLAAKGHHFRTRSDSEVVLHAYREYGDAFIQRIDGMFAFALWDASRRRLIVGRDRLGIKPLYYADDGRRFVFGSEIKALLKAPWLHAELEERHLQQYLELGYSPAPQTLYRGIRKLPPATLLIVDASRRSERKYWRLPSVAQPSLSQNQWLEALEAQVCDSVQSQMVSDVPLGAFLSGGLDSSSIVACMAPASKTPVKTYSIGFDTGRGASLYNELPFAKLVADKFGTDHHEIIVRPDAASLLPKLIWHLDEPIADSAIFTTYMVARFASESVTVILSGVGGDELFGGYRRYLGQRIVRWYLKIPTVIRRHAVKRLLESLPVDRHNWALNYIRLARGFARSAEKSELGRYRSYMQVLEPTVIDRLMGRQDPDPFDALGTAFSHSDQTDPLNRLMDTDLATQMVDDLLMLTDKTTMAASIECRVPLLDTRLVELAARMPSELKIKGHTLKYAMRQAFARRLPADLLRQPKRGFGAPIGAWINTELRPAYAHLLGEHGLKGRQIFAPEAIDQILSDHLNQAEDYTDGIQALANLEVWMRLFIDGTERDELADELRAAIDPTAA